MPYRTHNHPKYASQDREAHLFNQFFTLSASLNYSYSLQHIQHKIIKAESHKLVYYLYLTSLIEYSNSNAGIEKNHKKELRIK